MIEYTSHILFLVEWIIQASTLREPSVLALAGQCCMHGYENPCLCINGIKDTSVVNGTKMRQRSQKMILTLNGSLLGQRTFD
jgi:hypothetical protein